jgi:hypothetical protein
VASWRRGVAIGRHFTLNFIQAFHSGTKRSKIVNWLAKNSSLFGANSLDVEDWQLLEKTHSFVQPFNQATLMIEKRDSSLSQAIMVNMARKFQNADGLR